MLILHLKEQVICQLQICFEFYGNVFEDTKITLRPK